LRAVKSYLFVCFYSDVRRRQEKNIKIHTVSTIEHLENEIEKIKNFFWVWHDASWYGTLRNPWPPLASPASGPTQTSFPPGRTRKRGKRVGFYCETFHSQNISESEPSELCRFP
jgi:hypothetical protein